MENLLNVNNSNDDDNDNDDEENLLNRSCEGSVVSTISELNDSSQAGSVSSVKSSIAAQSHDTLDHLQQHITLSKSLGARSFVGSKLIKDRQSQVTLMPPLPNDEPPSIDDTDEQDHDHDLRPPQLIQNTNAGFGTTKDYTWISAAISIKYPTIPPTSKFTR